MNKDPPIIFQCTECLSTYKTKEKCKRHMKRVHAPKLHKCQACECSYIHRKSLLAHFSKHKSHRISEKSLSLIPQQPVPLPPQQKHSRILLINCISSTYLSLKLQEEKDWVLRDFSKIFLNPK